MDILNGLKSSYYFLGFRERNKTVGLLLYLYGAMLIILMTNIVYYVFDKWDDIDCRVTAGRAIAFLALYLGYMMSLYFSDSFSCMLNMFSDFVDPVPFNTTPQRKNLVNKLVDDLKNLDRQWMIIVVSYIVPLNIIPVIIVMTRVTYFSEDFEKVINDKLSTPFPLYYPKYINQYYDMQFHLEVFIYIFGYIFQSACLVFVGIYAHLVYMTPFCAMTRVLYEMKFLRLSLLEMDNLVRKPSEWHGKISGAEQMAEMLTFFSTYFGEQHENTYRKFNITSRGIKWIAGTTNATASVYLCISIYTLVQKDQIFFIIQETLYLVISASIFYLFDVYGEKIKSEDEKLRNALYECVWVDKTKVFKTSLLIAMTRTCKALELTPFGLITLNLKSFATTMNAAYSYYNLLSNFKSK